MRNKNRIGEKYTTTEGYEIEIIEYIDANNCSIKFNDNRKTIKDNIAYREIKKGVVKNLYHKSVYSMGYYGEGSYRDRRDSYRGYLYWIGILKRCYGDTESIKNRCYSNVTVCEEWHNFQNFIEWFYENYNPEIMEKWQLDKDLLIKGNRIYSPETCAFVPSSINNLLIKNQNKKRAYPTGVNKRNKGYEVSMTSMYKRFYLGVFPTIEQAFQAYKTAKEVEIKRVANEYKGLITDKVYEALMNYEVGILD